MAKRFPFTFPHSLMIFILNDYSVNNNRTTNLNDFIQKSNIGDNAGTIAAKTKDILCFLEKEGLIIWYDSKPDFDTGENRPKEDYKKYFAENTETLENNRISALLTVKGLDYTLNLISHKKQYKSVIKTNKSIKKLNGLLRWTNILALIISALTAIFIAMQFFKDDTKDLQPINKQLKQIENRLDSLQQSQRANQPSSLKRENLDSL
jgi:hypothetical protein